MADTVHYHPPVVAIVRHQLFCYHSKRYQTHRHVNIVQARVSQTVSTINIQISVIIRTSRVVETILSRVYVLFFPLVNGSFVRHVPETFRPSDRAGRPVTGGNPASRDSLSQNRVRRIWRARHRRQARRMLVTGPARRRTGNYTVN